MSKKPLSNVTVYGCGGMGVNLVSDLEAADAEHLPGFAKMENCYIDTSEANLIGKNVPQDRLFVFEGIDGSGKKRASNYEDISKHALGILQKFKPGALNIVIHSCSGGSGSVIGPVLVSELKNRGEQVIVILVGSTDTRIEIENTIKTLKSYEAIAAKRKSPIVTHYLENTREHNRTAVNALAKKAVSLLCGLFSGQNEEMDSADLDSWLNYLHFTGGDAQLSSLNFLIGHKDIERAGTVVSVATLALPEMDTSLPERPAYQTVGFVPAIWRKGVKDGLGLIGEEPIHFAVSPDFITAAVNRLNATLKDVDEAFGSRVARSSILDKGDQTTDSGVLL